MSIDKRDRLLTSAVEAQKAGRFEEAERLCEEVLEVDENCVSAMFLLGVLFARKGDSLHAGDLLKRVLKAEPRSYEALISYSTIRLDTGELEDAALLAQRAVEVRPGEAHSYNHLGRCFLAMRRLSEAVDAFHRAISLQPRFAPPYYNLGKALQLLGKDGDAAKAYGSAVQLSPSLTNLLAFGQALLTIYDYEKAEACARHCLMLDSNSAAAHLLLCGVLIERKDVQTAELHLRRAVELDPDGLEALQLAARQRPLGHIDEANENLRRAIRQSPSNVSAYDSLVHNSKVAEKDRPLVSQMQSLLQERSLSPTELASLHYGLGKALEDLAEYEQSMIHYDEANRLTRQIKFGDIPFDGGAYKEYIDTLIESFSPKSTNRDSKTSSSEVPILVLGMMRSGTTLAEQILSSHPKVEAAGEQLFWSINWRRALDREPSVVAQIGNEYVEFLKSIGPNGERVTDKMPGNYHFAGLIHLALPNARIVHMRRSPADTCLSIWATPNQVPQEGGHNKRDIVFVYKQYLRMMEHWRSLLPPDRLLEIDYEALVSNREAITRRMVEFCGLDWNDACLRPEENRRLVSTPSLWQVRQPVYKTSVERWRKFEPWLGTFRDLLEIAQQLDS